MCRLYILYHNYLFSDSFLSSWVISFGGTLFLRWKPLAGLELETKPLADGVIKRKKQQKTF